MGFAPEISPSVRLAYHPAPELTFWTAASRSINTPPYTASDVEVRVAQIPPEWFLAENGVPLKGPALGKFLAIVPNENVKVTDYYTLEAGHRGSHGHRLQWDVSTFYCWVRNQFNISPFDSTLQSVIPSRVHLGDSITPLYGTNLLHEDHFGGESLLRILPADFLSLELSYSLFWVWRAEGLPIPGVVGKRFHPLPEDGLKSPRHVGRTKINIDLPWETSASLNGILSSPFSRGARFNYANQSNDPTGGIIVDPARVQFQLDLLLRKSFFRDRASFSVWGRNLLEKPFVEVHNPYAWTNYPHQIHRTFGTGLEYSF